MPDSGALIQASYKLTMDPLKMRTLLLILFCTNIKLLIYVPRSCYNDK